ncbi:hypothetical protein [Curvivirga aplysinae]|uniref:hypothetical protein n=1 Tax=Curvivirga aplysinae TaxID=2529852 RepID=UPI0012BC44A4|nr:hypothetical protein [Curvivirga aplysinae]MTI10191.1 hypothetical protein [Curvivirga aplysinae]
MSVNFPPPPQEIKALGPNVTKWFWAVFLTLVTKQGLDQAIAELQAATTSKSGLVKMAVASADALPTEVAEGDSTDIEKLATSINALTASVNELKQHMRNAGLLENQP